jgi:acyl-CoA synthetase (AMP-forming)/AMP-acid ligase II
MTRGAWGAVSCLGLTSSTPPSPLPLFAAEFCTISSVPQQALPILDQLLLIRLNSIPDPRSSEIQKTNPITNHRLISEAGTDITADDTPGEACVRGPTIAKGYFNNPSANAASYDSEGYFKTGEILYRSSATKKWYIVDRKKELIKVRDFQVAPPEIEGLLLDHPDIVDCAVIGLKPTMEGGGEERPRAYVVRRPGSAITEEEVKRVVSRKLVAYKQLTGGVVFLDKIPKSAVSYFSSFLASLFLFHGQAPNLARFVFSSVELADGGGREQSGKILKRVLREEAEKELRAPRAKI